MPFYEVSGTVKDAAAAPIEGVALVALSDADFSYVGHTLSGADGTWAIQFSQADATPVTVQVYQAPLPASENPPFISLGTVTDLAAPMANVIPLEISPP